MASLALLTARQGFAVEESHVAFFEDAPLETLPARVVAAMQAAWGETWDKPQALRVGVALGPGRLTATRAGVACARTLGLMTGAAVYGFGLLEALTLAAGAERAEERTILATALAPRGMVAGNIDSTSALYPNAMALAQAWARAWAGEGLVTTRGDAAAEVAEALRALGVRALAEAVPPPDARLIARLTLAAPSPNLRQILRRCRSIGARPTQNLGGRIDLPARTREG